MGPRAAVGLSGEPDVREEQSYRVHEAQPSEWHVQLMKDGDWFSLYRFELLRYGETDCELGHFFPHRHPDAVIVDNAGSVGLRRGTGTDATETDESQIHRQLAAIQTDENLGANVGLMVAQFTMGAPAIASMQTSECMQIASGEPIHTLVLGLIHFSRIEVGFGRQLCREHLVKAVAQCVVHI